MHLKLISTICLLASTWPALLTAQESVDGRFLNAGGTRLYFTVEGEGEPVVLLHGFMADAELNWRLPGITAALAESHRVIAIDARGHGQSDKPRSVEAYGPRMVSDVMQVLDELEIKRAHVVGYSMGGFIAMKLLVEHPDRCISVVLAGSGGIRDDYDHSWNDAMAEKLEMGQSLQDAFLSSLPDDVEIDKTAALVMLQPLFQNQDTAALVAVLRSWRELAVSYDQLKSNELPVLLIYGSQEDKVTKKYITQLKGRLPQAEFRMIEGTNHLTTVLNPEFRESLVEFIRAHAGS